MVYFPATTFEDTRFRCHFLRDIFIHTIDLHRFGAGLGLSVLHLSEPPGEGGWSYLYDITNTKRYPLVI
jgi:hypothetical protein